MPAKEDGIGLRGAELDPRRPGDRGPLGPEERGVGGNGDGGLTVEAETAADGRSGDRQTGVLGVVVLAAHVLRDGAVTREVIREHGVGTGGRGVGGGGRELRLGIAGVDPEVERRAGLELGHLQPHECLGQVLVVTLQPVRDRRGVVGRDEAQVGEVLAQRAEIEVSGVEAQEHRARPHRPGERHAGRGRVDRERPAGGPGTVPPGVGGGGGAEEQQAGQQEAAERGGGREVEGAHGNGAGKVVVEFRSQ